MNKENNTTNNKKLKFKVVYKNNKAALEKLNKDNDHFINKQAVEIKSLHYKNLSPNDWQEKIEKIWVSDGSLDEDALLMMINDNREQIEAFKKLKRNFKLNHPGVYRFRYGRVMKDNVRAFVNDLERYLITIDDVIYNVEADWNDGHTFDKELNLYNTTLRKIDNNSKTKSILIEKPVEYNSEDIKTNKDMVWNSTILKKAVENYTETFDIKSFDKYINSISYNTVSHIANKTIEEAFTVKGFINALQNLWEVISTRKVNLLKTTLYGLINSLNNDSENVQNIVKKLNKSLSSYSTSPDTEILNDIVRSINVDDELNSLENEINEYKIILDIILRKYSITQHAAQALFIKEVKDATNFDSRLERRGKNENVEFDKNDVTEVKSTDALADYNYANRFRASVYNEVEETIKEMKNAKVDETVLNKYFEKINIEAGIIHDLTDLDYLLELQFSKDRIDFAKQYKPTEDERLNTLLTFVYEQLFILKRSKTFNLIYENVLLHLRNLLNLENELEQLMKKSDHDWLIYFNKWVEHKKSYLTLNKKVNVAAEDLEVNLTKGRKHTIKKQQQEKRQEQQVVKQPEQREAVKSKVKYEDLMVLQNKFGKSGYKIQEIVNEIGKTVGNDDRVIETSKVKGPKLVKLKNKFGRSGQRIENVVKETKQELKKAAKKNN